MSVDVMKELHGDAFDFRIDAENFCVEFRLREKPENRGKIFLQNRFRCLKSTLEGVVVGAVVVV